LLLLGKSLGKTCHFPGSTILSHFRIILGFVHSFWWGIYSTGGQSRIFAISALSRAILYIFDFFSFIFEVLILTLLAVR
jgi:hypothetical protein